MPELKISETNFGEKPKYSLPDAIFLKELGEEGLIELFDDFYDLLIESDIGNLFPQDEDELSRVKAHNVQFFIEACGGPKYYSKTVGHFDMIKAHEPFSITQEARVKWLECMKEILAKTNISKEAKESFWDYLEVFSKHTVNVKTGSDLPENIVKV